MYSNTTISTLPLNQQTKPKEINEGSETNNYERLFHCSTCLKTFKR